MVLMSLIKFCIYKSLCCVGSFVIMPQCGKCLGHTSPFTKSSRIKHGCIQCLDCGLYIPNRDSAKLKHWSKKDIEKICYCYSKEL